VKLFVTKKTAAIQVDTYDCIGSGAHLAGCGKKTRWDVTPEQIWSSMLYARR